MNKLHSCQTIFFSQIDVICAIIKKFRILTAVLKLKQNFQKNKVVTGKTPFFVIGPLCCYHFICLKIGF